MTQTNRNGVQLKNRGTHCVISKPITNPKPDGPVCVVYHVGSQSYINKLWKKQYAKA